jgi:hypothetical protein
MVDTTPAEWMRAYLDAGANSSNDGPVRRGGRRLYAFHDDRLLMFVKARFGVESGDARRRIDSFAAEVDGYETAWVSDHSDEIRGDQPVPPPIRYATWFVPVESLDPPD